ncbi:MAG: TPM domain-containing protein [Roseovarius sp.]
MKYFVSIVFICLAGFAAAQSYPEPSDLSVNDFAGLIDDEAEQRLTDRLDALRGQTGVELVVVTLSRQDMFAPDMSLKKFGRDIFDEWGIGDAERDDGILVLVLRADQAMRITLGQGYDEAADEEADAAVDRSFLPEFREGRYAEGIETGVEDLIANVVRVRVDMPAAAEEVESAAEAQATDTAEEAGDGSIGGETEAAAASAEAEPAATEVGDGESGELSVLAWIGGGIAALIGFFIFKSKTRKCPQCGVKGSLRTVRSTLVEPTETSAGRGERVTTCGKCDYSDTDTYELAKLEKDEPKPAPKAEPEGFSGGKAGKKGSTGKW